MKLRLLAALVDWIRTRTGWDRWVRAGLGTVIGIVFGLNAAAGPSEIVVSGELDHREYRYLELANELRVVLVSDSRADKSAAALDIRIGSGSDPVARAGLAHFLEHMLFLGTKKYPEAGEYQRFVQSHGGSNNASTSFEHTNYYFEIEPAHFEGALDRFSQFFIAPLFDEQFVERERHAVHSEYQTRLKDDSSRAWDAMKQVFNPAHPASRFNIGSLDTLSNRDDQPIRAALVKFWQEQYSANRMTLAVAGPQPLEKLEALVRERFSEVENRQLPLERITEPLYAPGRLPALLRIQPERDIRSLGLVFPIPPTEAHFRKKPTYYLSNLVGHEGKGSLLSSLKRSGWVDGLSSGLGFTSRSHATFRIDVSLTEAGVKHVPEIIQRVFDYLALVRGAGIDEWRSGELRQLLDIDFKFRETASAMRQVTNLAAALHVFPPSELLTGPYRITGFDAELIRDYLSYLRPDNMLATLRYQGVETDKISPFFKAAYSVGPVPSEWAARWTSVNGAARSASVAPSGAPAAESDSMLPSPNPFIPTSLALIAADDAGGPGIPRRLVERPGFHLWHQLDTSFEVPKANVFLSVRSPVALTSPRNAVLTSLYLRMVRDQLQEFSYPASLAGLSYAIYRNSRGFTVKVSGYADKLPVLARKVLESVRAPTLKLDRFMVEYDDLTRQLANQTKDRSFRLAMRETSGVLLEPAWSYREQAEALTKINFEDLERFGPTLLSKLDLVALVHGNVSAERAEALGNELAATLRSEVQPVPRIRVVKLPAGARYQRTMAVEHQDSGIVVYLQGNSRVLPERARFGLLAQILSSPFYFQLRTQQQLGYVVFATSMPLIEVPGIAFIIQSPVAGPKVLETQIRSFLSDFGPTLKAMSDAEFETHKAGLRSKILEADKTLRERSERYWIEIDRERYNFDSRIRMAAAVSAISKTDFDAFFERTVLGPARKDLVVHARGRAHADDELAANAVAATVKGVPISISDRHQLKRGAKWYP